MVTREKAGGLRKEVEQLRAELAEREAANSALREENAQLRHNLEVYRRLAFGTSSEKRRPADKAEGHSHQGHLFYAELVSDAQRASEESGAIGSIEATPPKRSRPSGAGSRRKKFPDHVPHVTTRYELPEDERNCACGNSLHEIGTESTPELERVDVTVGHEIQRVKYGCRNCEESIVTAPGPQRPLPKGILGRGFLAQLIVERMGNHMPFHRLEKKYASEGPDVSRSVLERSSAGCASKLEPISALQKEQILTAHSIHTDDTPVTLAQGSQGSSSQGRIWIYVDHEGRHFYDFTESERAMGQPRFSQSTRATSTQMRTPGTTTCTSLMARRRSGAGRTCAESSSMPRAQSPS